MGRRVKMTLSDILDLGISYHAFQRISNAGTKVKGYLYILDRPITPVQEYAVNQFKNTQLSACHYRGASEIQYNTLILWDRCVKKKGVVTT